MSMKFPIERFRKAATPLYYYDMELLQQTLDKIKGSVSRYGFNVHYAMKANANPAILRRISEAGFGADTVSGGEIAAAINAGFKAEDIVFAGVGKTDGEILLGLREGIGCFNVESTRSSRLLSSLLLRKERWRVWHCGSIRTSMLIPITISQQVWKKINLVLISVWCRR